MDSSSWIAIYLPIFLVLVIIIPAQRRNIYITGKIRKKRGVRKVSNELIKSCIGKTCSISTGTLGSSYNKVKVIEVIDNWIRIDSKGRENLINSDYIQNIKILSWLRKYFIIKLSCSFNIAVNKKQPLYEVYKQWCFPIGKYDIQVAWSILKEI